MPSPSRTGQSLQVAIVGAGLAGLCLAIKLKQAGITSFAVLEKSGRIGGTWRDNTYPGAACDIPSHLYSFSFERRADWSRTFATQPEILGYIEELARKYDLYPHIRLNTALAAAHFERGAWHIRTESGEEITAKALVTACGQLNRPRIPDLPGRDIFAGSQFHSARWDHDVSLAGKRVAVIGNGASAIQIIPQIAPVAAKLHVFQRSANWLVPRKDGPYSRAEKWIFRHVPLTERLRRWAIYAQLDVAFAGFRQRGWVGGLVGRIAEHIATRHLNRQVADPRLRALLRPDYPMGCKRVLIADDYYPALQRPNVELVTAPLQCLTRDSIVTTDGTARPIDVVIYATGFEATEFLASMEIVGAEGVPLRRRWQEGAEAYYGMAVPGFPNFFMMYGPNTNLGHNSIVFMIECQANYIRRCLERLLNGGLAELEVKPEAMAQFESRLQKDLAHTVWNAACRNWYKTASGKIVTNWSGFTAQYWWRTLRPNFGDFRTLPGNSMKAS